MGALKALPARAGEAACRAGRWLLPVGAVLGAVTVFFALVPAEIGVWPRFEIGGMALFLAAGICAVGLLFTWRDDRTTVEGALRHPLVLLAMLIALAGGIFAPFTDYPWLSILGYPLIGEGALRYLAMGIVFAAAMVLRHDPRGFRLLLGCLLLGSLVGMVALFLWTRSEFVGLEFAGILVIAAWVGAWYLAPESWGTRRFGVCFAAVVPILLLSQSQTAVAAVVAVGLPASVLFHLNGTKRWISIAVSRRIAALAIMSLPFVGMLVVWAIPEFTDALPSITSRKFTYQLIFAALHADPAVILAGQGWGEIVMTMDLFRTASDAILWDGSWDGATRDLPHSHNLVLEALFGGGAIAVLGLLAMLAVPVLVCRDRDLPVAVFATSVFAGIGAIWPQLAMTVGPVALAIGLTCAPAMPGQTRFVRSTGTGLAFALPVVASILVGAGVWLVSEGIKYERSVADVRALGAQSAHACDLLPDSAIYGDLDLAQGFAKAYRPVLLGAQEARAISEQEDRLIAAFLCSAEARALESNSPSLHLGLESFRGLVSSDAGRTPGIAKYADSLSGWADKLIMLLNTAPTRSDMTFTFFTARMQSGAWPTVHSLARALLGANPNDPIANWYLGQYLLNQNDPAAIAAGNRALRRSLRYGIKRFIPIPKEVEDAILGGPAGFSS